MKGEPRSELFGWETEWVSVVEGSQLEMNLLPLVWSI